MQAGNPFNQIVQEKLTPEIFFGVDGNHPACSSRCRIGQLPRWIDRAPPKEITVNQTVSGKEETVMIENPNYMSWNKKDWQFLYFLLRSISCEVRVQLIEHEMAHAAWKDILDMFSLRPQSRFMNLRRTLSDRKKREMAVAVYFGKLKAIVDELISLARRWTEMISLIPS
jgi:hypothetical protein